MTSYFTVTLILEVVLHCRECCNTIRLRLEIDRTNKTWLYRFTRRKITTSCQTINFWGDKIRFFVVATNAFGNLTSYNMFWLNFEVKGRLFFQVGTSIPPSSFISLPAMAIIGKKDGIKVHPSTGFAQVEGSHCYDVRQTFRDLKMGNRISLFLFPTLSKENPRVFIYNGGKFLCTSVGDKSEDV